VSKWTIRKSVQPFFYNGYNKLHRQNLMSVEAGVIVQLNAVEADPFQE